MLKNYIKIAFRSLIKQRIYTAINVIGLAVSITACLLIASSDLGWSYFGGEHPGTS